MDNHLPYFGGLNKNFFRSKNLIQRITNKFIFYKELAPSLRRMRTKNKKTTEIFKEAYRSSIKNTDAYVGSVIQSLKNTYPNTVFIVTSDHGEAFMDHGVVGHGALSLYNELIRIPLLIHLPSEKSKIITETVSLISIAKTIAGRAGITTPQFKGNDLISDQKFSTDNNISCILYKCLSPNIHLGILDNETEIKGYNKLWSFTTPNEKYILEKDGEIEEYYHLSSDPFEKKNLMNDTRGKNIKIIKSLRKIIGKR
jgi:arylsulfatase A-like enzyme